MAKRSRRPIIYTKQVVAFMKICAEAGLSSLETKSKLEMEFQIPFNHQTIVQGAHKEKIYFSTRKQRANLKDVDRKRLGIINRFMHRPAYVVRDKIIEELGEAKYNLTEIKKIIHLVARNEENHKKRIKFPNIVDKMILEEMDFLDAKELKRDIFKTFKRRYNLDEIKQRMVELKYY